MPGDASVGIDEHDRVIGDGRGPERRHRHAAKRPPAGAPDGDRPHTGNLHICPAVMIKNRTRKHRGRLTECPEHFKDDIIERMGRSMPKARPSNWPSPTVQTLPDQVAEAILQRIATGELQPGHRLPAQRELAQSMGVGLAVIREAVQRLATLNIVEAAHGSGTIIRPFRWLPLLYDKSLFHLAMQRIGIRDLWEARRLLEGQIIRLAAQRRTELDLERMRDVLDAAKPLPETYGAKPNAQSQIPSSPRAG